MLLSTLNSISAACSSTWPSSPFLRTSQKPRRPSSSSLPFGQSPQPLFHCFHLGPPTVEIASISPPDLDAKCIHSASIYQARITRSLLGFRGEPDPGTAFGHSLVGLLPWPHSHTSRRPLLPSFPPSNCPKLPTSAAGRLRSCGCRFRALSPVCRTPCPSLSPLKHAASQPSGRPHR